MHPDKKLAFVCYLCALLGLACLIAAVILRMVS